MEIENNSTNSEQDEDYVDPNHVIEMTLSSLPIPDPSQNAQLILDEDNNTANNTAGQVYSDQPYAAQQQTMTSLPSAGEQTTFIPDPLLYPVYPHNNVPPANLTNHAKTNKICI